MSNSDPRYLPHVLVISGDTPDEREWEIEHPDGCPRLCAWWPAAAEVYGAIDAGRLDFVYDDRDGRYGCYVEYEVTNAGLDSLDGDMVTGNGLERWRALPPGRYIIEGWYTPGGWAGANPIDPDGGLSLIGWGQP